MNHGKSIRGIHNNDRLCGIDNGLLTNDIAALPTA